MTNTKDKPLDLGYIEADGVLRITVKDGEAVWVLDRTGQIDTQNPMDRCGGPFRITDYVQDSEGPQWFLFWIVDSYFPVAYVVQGESFADAYEYFVDDRAEYLKIEEDYLADYEDEKGEYVGNFSSDGTPVDTDNVQGREVRLVSIHFAPDPEEGR